MQGPMVDNAATNTTDGELREAGHFANTRVQGRERGGREGHPKQGQLSRELRDVSCVAEDGREKNRATAKWRVHYKLSGI